MFGVETLWWRVPISSEDTPTRCDEDNGGDGDDDDEDDGTPKSVNLFPLNKSVQEGGRVPPFICKPQMQGEKLPLNQHF